MKKIIFILLCFFCSWAATAAQPDSRLQKIDQQINSVKENLTRELNTRSQLLQSLQKTETNAGKLITAIKQTQENLNKQKNILNTLEIKAQTNQTILTTQQQLLSQQLRTAYLLGKQPYLKLLLTQQDPEQLNRMLVYYRYVTQNRINTIENLQKTLQELQTNQQQIKQQYLVLSDLNHQQQIQHDKIEGLNQQRHHLVLQINTTIQSKNQKLDQLLNNRRQLEQMLSQLQKRSLFSPAPQQNFTRQQGKFPWPTKGKVLNYFGTQINESELRWNGILIEAPKGQAVYAINSGKIVFAKWFAGYGLLLIINHGNGFMTLYGRNQNLYKKEGDIVKAGELIASVGNSGGYETPALYFALWHNANPVNPASWCQ